VALSHQVKKVRLNKATDAQLKSLPGLNSDDLVKKIKGVRPFKQVEDLVARTPGPEPRGPARSSAPR
jgi:DNA uptake protein ComE-like DNA-binding protein